jgi:aspartate/methionine/tyrosine aminotransferase
MDNINTSYIPTIKEYDIENYVNNFLSWVRRFDKKFCYYLLGKTWVCSVPLSWFNSTYEWFRITLLEEDEKKFKFILETIKDFILEFKK